MSANPINAHMRTLLAASESTFNTPVALAAAQAMRAVTVNLGRASQPGNVRAARDRASGRGLVSEFLEGDKDPVDFSLEYSQRGRSAIDSASFDLAVMKAAGLKQTINGSTSTVLSLVPTPIENGEFASLQLARFLGEGAALAEMELLSGGVVKSLKWSGGDKEVTVMAAGQGASKLFGGRIDSFTFSLAGTTSVTISAAEAKKLCAGLSYQIESEIVTCTAVNYSTGATTWTRGAYASTAAGHTAQPLYPYLPPSLSYGGTSPISEATASAILGSISPMRIMSWEVDLTTGIDLLPAETSSAYRQGPKSVRHDVKVKLKMVMPQDRADLLGYSVNRDTLQLTLSQGTSTGGIITFVMPYCEVMPFEIADTADDIAIIDLELRVRNNTTGDNAMTITLT